MDINSLLSPSEPAQERPSSPPPAKSSAKKPRKPRASKANNAAISSPRTRPHDSLSPAQYAIPSPPPMISPTYRLRAGATGTPPADGSRPARQPSTPGMDTLADLASMQHHQQTARENAGGLRSTEIYESQTPATVLPGLHPLARPQGSLRGSLDLTMTDSPAPATTPRKYSTASMSEVDLQAIAQLVEYIAANPFAYESHVQLIKLLHQGLISHVYPDSSISSKGDPHTYELLEDLHNAREAMSARFALGEELWLDWLQDQQLLADSLEDKIVVIESCQKAADEESGSTQLWLLYGNWMLMLYVNANPHDAKLANLPDIPSEDSDWSEEDRIVAREVCTWQQLLDVWKQGARDTMWRMNDSHLLWDRYTELLLQEYQASPRREIVNTLESHFMERLQIPHVTWDQTFQAFSRFISTNFDDAEYETRMVRASQQASSAKEKFGLREIHEINIQRAADSSDKEAEWRQYTNYIDWEFAQSRRKNSFSFELVNALYERVTLRFPTDSSLWEGYAVFLNDEITSHSRTGISALPVLDRATRHCPWSGTLWSLYLLIAERDKRSFPEMEQIKHKATSTGTLDAGGMEEMLKVHTAWCGFLRRRAFMPDSTDEDQDVAEVGIRSAVEDMQHLGRMKYGKEYQGDPSFRLERIYLKYLTQCRNWQACRDIWKSLIAKHGDSYDFWIRYYLWEMSTWGKLAFNDHERNGVDPLSPSEATKVLRQAMKRPKLDWPEKVMEVFRFHCEDHEDADEISSSASFIWKTKRIVTKRRERESAETYREAQAQMMQQPQVQQEVSMEPATTQQSTKRKRNDEVGTGIGNESKRTRQENADIEMDIGVEAVLEPTALKRDRENATVVVKNLPEQTSETRIRQYFRNCGTINSLKLLADKNGESATATIEFESKEDVLTAQTKNMKSFEGRDIHVEVGSGTTLYVTNYPSAADEAWLRERFGSYGEIVDIRFPSLKFNAHRRFCYMQFRLPSQARAATELDGQKLDGKLTIVAKLSDPGQKQDRNDAMQEGRELYLANVDWSATEDEVKDAFSIFGEVEKVRIPRKVGGGSKGIAYVVFTNKDATTKALEMNLTRFKARVLSVSPSTNDRAKRQATTIINPANSRSSYSPTPDRSITNGMEAGSLPATAPEIASAQTHRSSAPDRQARTIALMNVPDTVTSDRIRVLAENHGALVKIQLRPDHQGAILEYVDAASAGKAGLAFDGNEIDPGRKLRVGTVPKMLREKEEYKSDKFSAPKKKENTATLQSSMPIRRPGQPGTRRGGRGGLGVKRGGVGLNGGRGTEDGAGGVASKETGKEHDENGAEAAAKAKSNADFKAMFLKQ